MKASDRIPTPAELVAELTGHEHTHYVPNPPGTLTDCSDLTPAEVYELDHPGVQLTQDQAVAFNALSEACNLSYLQGVATADEGTSSDRRARFADLSIAAERLVFDFITKGKVRP